MNRIKNFKQFSVSEAFDPTMVALLARSAQLQASKDEYRSGVEDEGATGATAAATTGIGANKTQAQIDADLEARFGNGPKASDATIPVSTSSLFKDKQNGDFILYMAHQQGVPGSTNLIKVALGAKDKLLPDIVATKKMSYGPYKGQNLKYANIVANIPSDRPEIKKSIIGYLDKGDHKSAANQFLQLWKDKYASGYKSAKREIDKPQNKKAKDAIAKACIKYGIPFDFATAVAMIESSFRIDAGKTAKYRGLYALSPTDAYGGLKGAPIGDKWSDPEKNADVGMQLMVQTAKQVKAKTAENWASLNVGDWANNLA